MATTVTTVDGNRLDLLCWRHYGHLHGSVEAVLEANPGLAEYAPVLPAGMEITMPELPDPRRVTEVRLW